MGLGSGATASSSEGAPPTEVNHFGFDESEVDYGDDDDRTPEEKAEDEELLEKTKTKVEAFPASTPRDEEDASLPSMEVVQEQTGGAQL